MLSKDQTPTNLHQRIEIANAKSKSKAENYKSHSIRPTIAITENYVKAQSENPVRAVPENRSYYSTPKYGKKTCVVGDSQMRRI